MEEMQQSDEENSVAVKSNSRKISKQVESGKRCALWPDERDPEESFTLKGRKWIFLETAKNSEELDTIRKDKFHCNSANSRITTGRCRITLACMNSKVREGCAFKLFIQKTDRGRFHIYGSDEHTCNNDEELQQIGNGKPPSELTRTVRGVDRQYNFVKTVHSMQELYDIGIENGCSLSELRRNRPNFGKISLQCSKNSANPKCCPFTLLAWRPKVMVAETEKEEENAALIHVYAHDKHNHQLNKYKWLKVTVFDKQPPASITTPNGREWTFMETANKNFFEHQQLAAIQRKYKCYYSDKKLRERKQQQQQEQQQLLPIWRATLYCMSGAYSKCPFALLAQRTDQDRYHLYASDKHTCLRANTDENVLSRNAVLPDANPPSSIVTLSSRMMRNWAFSETLEPIEQTGKNLAQLARMLERKYHCLYAGNIKETEMRQHFICYRMQFYCTAIHSSKCRFRILVQKTDRNRFHLYVSGNKHTCLHKDESLLPLSALLPDAHPPVSFATRTCPHWTFLETTMVLKQTEGHLIALARKIGLKYHCHHHLAIKRFPKGRRFICRRMHLCCSTIASSRCRFRILAQKTDQDRFHLYASGKHTCIYKNTVIRKAMTESNRPVKEKEEDGEDKELEVFQEEEELGVEDGEVMEELPKHTTWPDEDPLTNFSMPNGRQWTFAETASREKERDIDQIDQIRRKYHCSIGITKAKRETIHFINRVTLHCSLATNKKCSFAVLAQKTNRGHYHLYISNKHTCLHKDKERSAVLQNALFSYANPPTNFITSSNNRHWNFLETMKIEEGEGTLLDSLHRLKRKFHCRPHRMKEVADKTLTLRRVTLYCSVAKSSKCIYAVLVQKTDRESHFHLYESEKHTCLHRDGGENLLTHYTVLPDAHPPASVVTRGGRLMSGELREWTFLETTKTGKTLTKVIRMIRRKYSCIYSSVKNLTSKRRRSAVCRLQLCCTMRCAATGKCMFMLLAQKTDRDRYHLYAFGRHTCFHANEGEGGVWQEDEEEEIEEEEEYDDEEEEEYNDEEEEDYDDEEEEEYDDEDKEEYDDEKEEYDDNVEDEEETTICLYLFSTRCGGRGLNPTRRRGGRVPRR